MPQPLEPIRVLIADDDRRVRIALTTLLTSAAGFDVVGSAGTVAGALALAREHRPDVALVDMLMPEAADGLGLVREFSAALRIPALAMSVDGGMRGQAIAAGAIAFVDKDGAPDELVSTLRGMAC